MDSVFWQHVGGITGLITLFIPVHQALIELYKLFGAKRRRYWEALAYIVYGSAVRSPSGKAVFKALDRLAIVPHGLNNVGDGIRDQWMSGPQRDLIQGFLLRALGSSPVADVSDADARNVVEIARLCAPPPIRELSRAFEQMARTQTTVSAARELLSAIAIARGHREPVEGYQGDTWVEPVKEFRDRVGRQLEGDPTVNPAVMLLQEERFNELFLPGAVRGRRELANALKAAEFRYQDVLYRWSMALAFVESVILAYISSRVFTTAKGGSTLETPDLLMVGALAFAAMVLGSQGGKSVLDAVIGIGTRLKR